jgi:hypothetical protein
MQQLLRFAYFESECDRRLHLKTGFRIGDMPQADRPRSPLRSFFMSSSSMFLRSSLFACGAFLIAASLVAPASWGQTPSYGPPQFDKDTPLPSSAAPAGVDAALRARVTEFLQFSVDKNFRKAFDYVAEESKDTYFAVGKADVVKFNIVSTKYSADFSHATVRVDVTQNQVINVEKYAMPAQWSTTWKTEEGKWVYYLDVSKQQLTPMTGLLGNPRPTELIHQDADGTVKLPEKIGDPAVMQAQMQTILALGKIDKSDVSLSLSKASEDRIVFHNGTTGFLSLALYSVPKIPGLSATIEKQEVGPNQDSIVLFKYVPPTEKAAAGAEELPAPGTFVATLAMEPLTRNMPITVNFK